MSSPCHLPARAQSYVALDFETTGVVKGYPSLPWQLGAVTLTRGTLDLGGPRFDTYLRVPADYPFSRHAPGEYRANRGAIAVALAFAEVWPQLHQCLASAIPVAHNTATERNLLLRFAPMTHYPYWVDTLPLARAAYPGLSSYALEALIPYLGLQARLEALVPARAPHDAYYDAVACALLLEHLLALPAWSALTVADIVCAGEGRAK